MRRLIQNLAPLSAVLLAAASTASAQEARYEEEIYESEWPAQGGYGEPPRVDVDVDLATPGASVTFDTFHDGLAPYGEWVTVSSYGRVWRPRVAAGWRPYYYGRWEWTDEGWLWVSDEPWGWAAYHYGRWTYDPMSGWLWVPGYQWAPAWVVWRYSPDYVGWAPLAPGFSLYVTSYPVHYGWWSFVPCRRFVGVRVHSVAYTGSRVRNLWHGTRPAPPRAAVMGAHAPAWGGPARTFLERTVGRPIAPVRVQPVASPSALGAAARSGVVPIYRPEVRVGRPAPTTALTAPGPRAGGAVAPGSSWGARPAPGANWGAARPAPASPQAPAVRPMPGTTAHAPSAPGPSPWRSGGSTMSAPGPSAAPRTSAAPRSVPAPAPRHQAPAAPQGQLAPSAPRYQAPPAAPRYQAPAPVAPRGNAWRHAPARPQQ